MLIFSMLLDKHNYDYTLLELTHYIQNVGAIYELPLPKIKALTTLKA